MTEEEYSLPYLLTGFIFYSFGLKWCYDYSKLWYIPPKPRHNRDSPKLGVVKRFRASCMDTLTSHPIEGSLKLIATAVGLAGTLSSGMPESRGEIMSPNVVHATIYLFFAFSGLVDVLHFYFPRNVTNGLAKMVLAQSFFVEGFLYVFANVPNGNPVINTILANAVWLTSVAVALELVWPDVKLLTGALTLLHGSWIAHMVRVYHGEVYSLQRVYLTFSWHIAAASTVTLLAVAITRSCLPREPPPPPQVPIYDYCNELEIRST